MQLDAEGRLVGDGKVDLGVMPVLSRPAGGGGKPQFCDAEEERYVKIQADDKGGVDSSRLGLGAAGQQSKAKQMATAGACKTGTADSRERPCL